MPQQKDDFSSLSGMGLFLL